MFRGARFVDSLYFHCTPVDNDAVEHTYDAACVEEHAKVCKARLVAYMRRCSTRWDRVCAETDEWLWTCGYTPEDMDDALCFGKQLVK